MGTVELVPTLDAQITVAVGSLREELLPTEKGIEEKISSDHPGRTTVVAWIVFAVEVCRQLIKTRLELQRVDTKDLSNDMLDIEGRLEELVETVRDLRKRAWNDE